MSSATLILANKIDELSRRLKEVENTDTLRALVGTQAWNTLVIPDGDIDSTTVTIVGVETDDVVNVTHSALGSNNWILSAHVEGLDTVRVIALNKTGVPASLIGNLTIYAFQ
jgi:hypothetical protein